MNVKENHHTKKKKKNIKETTTKKANEGSRKNKTKYKFI